MAAITAFHGSPFSLLLAGGVLGLGQAFALTAMANLVVAAVAAGDVGIATGINGVMRTVGMALGSAMSAGDPGLRICERASDRPRLRRRLRAWPPASPRAPSSCAVAIRRPAAGIARVAHAARAARARVVGAASSADPGLRAVATEAAPWQRGSSLTGFDGWIH